ncbi:DUF221-domain-containing protein [Athelia psychrophila]|uniref:DUF221-domain-containing protein n=1 Tax=Athelia psychrophila TaxID=1759441 RepID=A0A166QYS3_9AGAM|nr:DUF221-domain-containing protein [Fibularhizoctonia sp. CBS 109695]
MSLWAFVEASTRMQDGGSDTDPYPPNVPPESKYEGPWFNTQVLLASSIGLGSFLVFSYCRQRWPLLFAPRTKLKGFSPHEAHAQQAFFGWILPTIRTSEYTVLQIVGLDAAMLLGFFKMSFYLFSVYSILVVTILMPVNWLNNIGPVTGPDDDTGDWPQNPDTDFLPPQNGTLPSPGHEWLDLINDANSYLTVHLLFTYLFTFLALRFTYNNYRRFVRARQLFTLELVHSISARTVLVTNLPNHLQGDRTLAEYFENMGLAVESVSVSRRVDTLKALLDKRTDALLKLEKEWVNYVGNPSSMESYDPLDNTADPSVVEGQPGRLVMPHHNRPTLRPGWFKRKVDALEYLEARFQEADEQVKKWRKSGKFRSSHAAFVTFEKMSSAQIACQTAHAPLPYRINTYPAPEPRDIVWSNMSHSIASIRVRELIALACMALLLLFWLIPITGLASLLSYKEIKKVMPWLGDLIDQNSKIRAIVQNSLPSVVMITLNSLVPFMLEALTYIQGYRARSWIEYSLMKKYHMFLLFNVVFVFLLASTYWQLVRDLANSPAKIPEKLAEALYQGRARHFFLSYVILQGLGIMPVQLLNLGVIIPRILMRIFVTSTPRDFAELNAPPMINYGVVYPQAILVFTIVMLYSVVQPLIVIFGAIYFGVAYIVYKYKLLFVFYKPYESQGQAWPITFVRLIWGVVMFQVFMEGILTLKGAIISALLLLPLLAGTILWAWHMHRNFEPLSRFVSLSSVCEVQRGEETADVTRLRAGHPVSWSQSNLNRRRYAQNDETLYVAPEDERTDYSQPPMANWYSGVLNTGKRRYGHPALLGVLPEPWLPLKRGQTLVSGNGHGRPPAQHLDSNQAVVLTLRKRYSRGPRQMISDAAGGYADSGPGDGSGAHELRPEGANANGRNGRPGHGRRTRTTPQPLHHRLSFDDASGVIMLPEGEGWLDEDSDSEDDYGSPSPLEELASPPLVDVAPPNLSRTVMQEQSSPTASPAKRRSAYSTYYHHPERRTRTVPGAFEAE